MQAKLITIDRQFTDNGNEDDYGWWCWARAWDSDDPNKGSFFDEAIIRRKKDAIAWAKKAYAGVKISYVTDCTRTRA